MFSCDSLVANEQHVLLPVGTSSSDPVCNSEQIDFYNTAIMNTKLRVTERCFGGIVCISVVIIIVIYCNWVVTRWQWLFYM